MKAMPRVGVLALQGDVAEHRAALARAGVVSVEIRTPADLADLDGIVLPGGESTTMLKLLELQRLFEPLGSLLRSGLPVLGTCAGAILLARSVEPAQRSFAVLDIDVCRNGGALTSPVSDARATLDVIEGIRRSHAFGVAVRLPLY